VITIYSKKNSFIYYIQVLIIFMRFTKLNHKINKYCILQDKKISDLYKLYENNSFNLSIVVDKKNKFIGLVTQSDIRRGYIRGLNQNAKIKDIVNKNPLIIKGKINENSLSNLISQKRFTEVEPAYFPQIDINNTPINLINKDKILSLTNSKVKITKKYKKVLLLGGAGYIGSNLTLKLLKLKYKVIVFDKFIYQSKNDFEKKINNKNLSCVKGDSKDLDKIFYLINNSEAVVHLAEMVGDPLCEKRPERTFLTNYLASISISSICRNLGISKFIYVSSCSVYGSNKDEKLLNENSKINPLSIYAKLKTLCEKALITNMGEYYKPCIIRLGTVFGKSLRPRYDLVINLFAGLVANNKEIKIEGGEQWRPFIHVDDVGDGIIKILKSHQKKTSGQIYNLVGENIQIKALKKIIIKKFPKAKISIVKQLKDFRDYKVSAQKAKKILGFKPKISIEQGLYDLVNFTKKNKIKNLNSKKFINILNSDKF